MNDYERAFEKYLRREDIVYFGVNQTFRWTLSGRILKNFDYMVLPAPGRQFIVEVKGRKLSRNGRFETWVAREDLESLSHYQWWLGGSGTAALCFVYRLSHPDQLSWFENEDLIVRGKNIYAPRMLSLPDFIDGCRRRSRSWDTFDLNSADFAMLARPPREFLKRKIDIESRKRAGLDLGVFQDETLGIDFEEHYEHFLAAEEIEV